MQALDETKRRPADAGALLERATVDSVDGAAIVVRSPRFGRARARLATNGAGYRPRPGDAVLVARADEGGLYVVGVVRALRDASGLVASDGTSAVLEEVGGQETLRVRDASGALLLEHRPAEGRTIVHAPLHLALRAEGDLELAAAGAVRVRAGTDVELTGRGDVRVAACDLDGAPASALEMREGRTSLRTRRLGADVGRADLRVQEANLAVTTLRTVARRVRQEMDLLEMRAGRILERAKEAWRETEGLSQTRAGRLRMVATGALQAIGEQALLKARDAVKVKGERIHLG